MRYLGVMCLCWLVSSTPTTAGNIFVRDAEQFEKYVPRLAPGDTIMLRSDEDSWDNVNLVFEAEGEPGRPIVLAARRPGQTVFTGQSRLRVLGRHLVVDGLVFKGGSLSGGSVISIGSQRGESAQDCRLTNTSIVDYNPSDPKVDYHWVSVFGKRNRVDHCYFKGQSHTGNALVVRLNGEANEHRIDHNYFAGRDHLGWNGAETIRIGTSSRSMQNSRTIVEDNLFENCDGEAEIISVKSCENVIRRNAFVSSAGAVTLRHGNRNRVEGNWFQGGGKPRTGGVRVIGEDHVVINNHFESLMGRGGRSAISIMNGVPDAPLNSYWQVKGGLVAHNTIIDCVTLFDVGFGAGGRGRTLPPLGVRVVANVVQPSNLEHAVVTRDSTSEIEWISNLWIGSDVPPMDGFESRTIAYSKGSFISEPNNYGGLEIAKGVDTVDRDIDGQKRTTHVAGSDVGSDARVDVRPPTSRTVGPDWMH
jgi:poly(beta-D-mannuronate) lyase